MVDKLHLGSDWVAVLAFVFGAAVIVPSMTALGLTLFAVTRMILF